MLGAKEDGILSLIVVLVGAWCVCFDGGNCPSAYSVSPVTCEAVGSKGILLMFD